MRFSPRLDDSLVAEIRRLDVDRLSIADVWRQAGELAVARGLCRPGYHSILALVHDERRRRAERRQAIVEAVDELWALTGTDYVKLAHRLAETRRP